MQTIWLGKTTDCISWQWSITRNDTANNADYAVSLALDDSGNVYVLGHGYGSGTGIDIWLGKTTDGISWQWSITQTSSQDDYARALVISGTDAYVLGEVYTVNSRDIWLGKTTDGIAWQWAITQAGTGNANDSAVALVVSGGNAYVLGNIVDSGSDYKIWLGKTTDGLNWQWSIAKSGTALTSDTRGVALNVDSSGNAYVLGQVCDMVVGTDIWLAKTTDGAAWAMGPVQRRYTAGSG